MSELENVFGLHAVKALLERHPKRVKSLWLQRGRLDERMQAVASLAEQQGITVERVTVDVLDQRADGVHQGVLAQVLPSQLWSEDMLGHLLDKLDTPPLLLVLDGVTDPHNLGACLRTADAAGVQAVIIPKDKSVGLTPVVRKVACGAAETVPLVAVTNLARCLKNLQQRGLWIVGAAGEAEQMIYQVDFSVPSVLVMGAEGSGMRRLTREHCDYLAKLPMAGSVSSLNVSVASGICLFEAVRQRQAAGL
ncbi:MAG: 23S rRNA (guanosine(2251)-2'-O)-methyltransferase RlmB [Gammaproteobacteria bacterium]|nr:23S rRNA (guanosine(2251)-2'-O)-methyltransferase RlmB [Gammaproteobacteria bacterium]